MFKNFFRSLINFLPKKYQLMLGYFKVFGVLPNINKPKNFNEKVLHRILYDSNSDFSRLADKYAVREYIARTLGKEYLVPLLFVTENPDDLLRMQRWNSIVIKPNHGAGMIAIFDEEPDESRRKSLVDSAHNWIKTDFGRLAGEYHYSLIDPKLLVEEKITLKSEDLRDYKFHRFLKSDGTFKQILQVVAERSQNGFETVFFDIDRLDKPLYSPFGYNLELSDYEKESIVKIVLLNYKLCPNIGYIRIDWYITRKYVYFGELTFTPGAGRSKSFKGDFGLVMGNLWIN